MSKKIIPLVSLSMCIILSGCSKQNPKPEN